MNDNAISTECIPTINSEGVLDNMIKMEWSSVPMNGTFKMINVYLMNIKSKMNKNINNKWLNSTTLQQCLGNKAIENMEWIVSTKFERKQLIINTSLISTVLQKWMKQDKTENKNRLLEQMLLFEITDLKYYTQQSSSMWCVIKMQNL